MCFETCARSHGKTTPKNKRGMGLAAWFLSALAYIKCVEMNSVVTKAAGEHPLCSAALLACGLSRWCCGAEGGGLKLG